MGSYLIRTLLWIGILTSLCSGLPAQHSAKTVAIVIEVKDQSGAIIENAQVQIAPAPNNIGKNLTTDFNGRLHLDLPPGIYDLIVASPGFNEMKKHVEVQTATQQLISVVLAVGECSAGCPIIPVGVPITLHTQSQLMSPNRNYEIVDIEVGWGRGYPHEVYLEDEALRIRHKLFGYERQVFMSWNPDSKMIAVTNFINTDSSRCSIFSIDAKVPPIPVLDLLFSQLSETGRENLKARLSNHRFYIEAPGWLKPMDLEVLVTGTDDKDQAGFSDRYMVHVDPRQQ